MKLSALGGGLILFGGSQASLSSSSPEVDKGEKLVATLKAKSVMMKMIKLDAELPLALAKILEKGKMTVKLVGM